MFHSDIVTDQEQLWVETLAEDPATEEDVEWVGTSMHGGRITSKHKQGVESSHLEKYDNLFPKQSVQQYSRTIN